MQFRPSALLTEKWTPTKEQNEGVVTRTVDFFLDELNELQEELGCPDEFIFDLLGAIRDRWSPESCYSKMRVLKKANPKVF